jgi:hypothetical protein
LKETYSWSDVDKTHTELQLAPATVRSGALLLVCSRRNVLALLQVLVAAVAGASCSGALLLCARRNADIAW